jgi:hypothetical protein
MKKLLLVLVVLLAVSCSKDEDCYCIEKTYEAVETEGVYSFELLKEGVIDCADEFAGWNEDNKFIVVRCY